LKKYHFSFNEILPYLDILSLGLWLGWGIGRIGCFFIHDHIGKLSNFFLAVDFSFVVPYGARHDLGLYDSLLGFLLFIVFILLSKKLIRLWAGLVAVWSFVCYAIVRFFLDFLRATDLDYIDARYAGLTPAQWGSIIFLASILTLSLFWNKIMSAKEK
ncbi:prolipoprotein diacylglyceryl transferase, partial [Patescibacteria group bacterium]|nr:prolipoprotein diacylglyceryl transferase [Patescibacteria group bacterium]